MSTMNALETATQNVSMAEAGLLAAQREADGVRRKAARDEAAKIGPRLMTC